jgi:hypothetical protein
MNMNGNPIKGSHDFYDYSKSSGLFSPKDEGDASLD